MNPTSDFARATVGADSIRPNVTEQRRWVNETVSNIVPFTAPLNSMRERADAIRPYRPSGEAAFIHRTALPICSRFLTYLVTGRVREPTYRYKPRSVIEKSRTRKNPRAAEGVCC